MRKNVFTNAALAALMMIQTAPTVISAETNTPTASAVTTDTQSNQNIDIITVRNEIIDKLGADLDLSFTYIITITDGAGQSTDDIAYTGSKSGTLNKGTGVVVLKNGESITFSVPKGCTWKVTENSKNNYTSNSKEESESSVGEKLKTVLFQNAPKVSLLINGKAASKRTIEFPASLTAGIKKGELVELESPNYTGNITWSVKANNADIDGSLEIVKQNGKVYLKGAAPGFQTLSGVTDDGISISKSVFCYENDFTDKSKLLKQIVSNVESLKGSFSVRFSSDSELDSSLLEDAKGLSSIASKYLRQYFIPWSTVRNVVDENGKCYQLIFAKQSSKATADAQNQQKYESEIGPLIKKLTAGQYSDIQKVSKIYAWITQNISYTFSNGTAWSVYVNRKGICGGYSALLADMCNRAGIPAEIVQGYAPSGIGHAWNLIRIAGKWYYFDATADRYGGGSSGLLRFCLTKDQLAKRGYKLHPKYETAAYNSKHPLGTAKLSYIAEGNDKTLYYIENGITASKTSVTINGIKYSTDWSGKVISQSKATGWSKESGKWYYYKSGKRVTGWLTISGKKYYLDASGAMKTGWQTISGKKYYFYSSGAMLTGFQTLSDSSGKFRFFFDSSGAMKTGWVKAGNKWYFFDGNGHMATGWRKVKYKGKDCWFLLSTSGAMLTGWQKVGGKWYYMDANGVMLKGWQKIKYKGKYVWFYMNGSGVMVTGWQTIKGKRYYFNASGVMLTGRQKINGKWYTFSSSGALK